MSRSRRLGQPVAGVRMLALAALLCLCAICIPQTQAADCSTTVFNSGCTCPTDHTPGGLCDASNKRCSSWDDGSGNYCLPTCVRLSAATTCTCAGAPSGARCANDPSTGASRYCEPSAAPLESASKLNMRGKCLATCPTSGNPTLATCACYDGVAGTLQLRDMVFCGLINAAGDQVESYCVNGECFPVCTLSSFNTQFSGCTCHKAASNAWCTSNGLQRCDIRPYEAANSKYLQVCLKVCTSMDDMPCTCLGTDTAVLEGAKCGHDPSKFGRCRSGSCVPLCSLSGGTQQYPYPADASTPSWSCTCEGTGLNDVICEKTTTPATQKYCLDQSCVSICTSTESFTDPCSCVGQSGGEMCGASSRCYDGKCVPICTSTSTETCSCYTADNMAVCKGPADDPVEAWPTPKCWADACIPQCDGSNAGGSAVLPPLVDPVVAGGSCHCDGAADNTVCGEGHVCVDNQCMLVCFSDDEIYPCTCNTADDDASSGEGGYYCLNEVSVPVCEPPVHTLGGIEAVAEGDCTCYTSTTEANMCIDDTLSVCRSSSSDSCIPVCDVPVAETASYYADTEGCSCWYADDYVGCWYTGYDGMCIHNYRSSDTYECVAQCGSDDNDGDASDYCTCQDVSDGIGCNSPGDQSGGDGIGVCMSDVCTLVCGSGDPEPYSNNIDPDPDCTCNSASDGAQCYDLDDLSFCHNEDCLYLCSDDQDYSGDSCRCEYGDESPNQSPCPDGLCYDGDCYHVCDSSNQHVNDCSCKYTQDAGSECGGGGSRCETIIAWDGNWFKPTWRTIFLIDSDEPYHLQTSCAPICNVDSPNPDVCACEGGLDNVVCRTNEGGAVGWCRDGHCELSCGHYDYYEDEPWWSIGESCSCVSNDAERTQCASGNYYCDDGDCLIECDDSEPDGDCTCYHASDYSICSTDANTRCMDEVCVHPCDGTNWIDGNGGSVPQCHCDDVDDDTPCLSSMGELYGACKNGRCEPLCTDVPTEGSCSCTGAADNSIQSNYMFCLDGLVVGSCDNMWGGDSLFDGPCSCKRQFDSDGWGVEDVDDGMMCGQDAVCLSGVCVQNCRDTRDVDINVGDNDVPSPRGCTCYAGSYNALCDWYTASTNLGDVLRPSRCIAGECVPQCVPEQSNFLNYDSYQPCHCQWRYDFEDYDSIPNYVMKCYDNDDGDVGYCYNGECKRDCSSSSSIPNSLHSGPDILDECTCMNTDMNSWDGSELSGVDAQTYGYKCRSYDVDVEQGEGNEPMTETAEFFCDFMSKKLYTGVYVSLSVATDDACMPACNYRDETEKCTCVQAREWTPCYWVDSTQYIRSHCDPSSWRCIPMCTKWNFAWQPGTEPATLNPSYEGSVSKCHCVGAEDRTPCWPGYTCDTNECILTCVKQEAYEECTCQGALDGARVYVWNEDTSTLGYCIADHPYTQCTLDPTYPANVDDCTCFNAPQYAKCGPAHHCDLRDGELVCLAKCESEEVLDDCTCYTERYRSDLDVTYRLDTDNMACPDGTCVSKRCSDTCSSNVVFKPTLTTVPRSVVKTVGGEETNEDVPCNTGSWAETSFSSIFGVVIHGSSMYAASYSCHTILKFDLTDESSEVLAGTGDRDLADGSLLEAMFQWPTSIDVSSSGRYLYVTDSGNSRIRRIDLEEEVVETLAGGGDQKGNVVGYRFQFSWLSCLWLDEAHDRLVVADYDQNRIVTVRTSGLFSVSHFAGSTTEECGMREGTESRVLFCRIQFITGSVRFNKVFVSFEDSTNIMVGDLTTARFDLLHNLGLGQTPGDRGEQPALLFDDNFGLLFMSTNPLSLGGSPNQIFVLEYETGDEVVVAGISDTQGSQDGLDSEATFSHPGAMSLDRSTYELYVFDDALLRRITLGTNALVPEVIDEGVFCGCADAEDGVKCGLTAGIAQGYEMRCLNGECVSSCQLLDGSSEDADHCTCGALDFGHHDPVDSTASLYCNSAETHVCEYDAAAGVGELAYEGRIGCFLQCTTDEALEDCSCRGAADYSLCNTNGICFGGHCFPQCDDNSEDSYYRPYLRAVDNPLGAQCHCYSDEASGNACDAESACEAMGCLPVCAVVSLPDQGPVASCTCHHAPNDASHTVLDLGSSDAVTDGKYCLQGVPVSVCNTLSIVGITEDSCTCFTADEHMACGPHHRCKKIQEVMTCVPICSTEVFQGDCSCIGAVMNTACRSDNTLRCQFDKCVSSCTGTEELNFDCHCFGTADTSLAEAKCHQKSNDNDLRCQNNVCGDLCLSSVPISSAAKCSCMSAADGRYCQTSIKACEKNVCLPVCLADAWTSSKCTCFNAPSLARCSEVGGKCRQVQSDFECQPPCFYIDPQGLTPDASITINRQTRLEEPCHCQGPQTHGYPCAVNKKVCENQVCRSFCKTSELVSDCTCLTAEQGALCAVNSYCQMLSNINTCLPICTTVPRAHVNDCTCFRATFDALLAQASFCGPVHSCVIQVGETVCKQICGTNAASASTCTCLNAVENSACVDTSATDKCSYTGKCVPMCVAGVASALCHCSGVASGITCQLSGAGAAIRYCDGNKCLPVCSAMDGYDHKACTCTAAIDGAFCGAASACLNGACVPICTTSTPTGTLCSCLQADGVGLNTVQATCCNRLGYNSPKQACCVALENKGIAAEGAEIACCQAYPVLTSPSFDCCLKHKALANPVTFSPSLNSIQCCETYGYGTAQEACCLPNENGVESWNTHCCLTSLTEGKAVVNECCLRHQSTESTEYACCVKWGNAGLSNNDERCCNTPSSCDCIYSAADTHKVQCCETWRVGKKDLVREQCCIDPTLKQCYRGCSAEQDVFYCSRWESGKWEEFSGFCFWQDGAGCVDSLCEERENAAKCAVARAELSKCRWGKSDQPGGSGQCVNSACSERAKLGQCQATADCKWSVSKQLCVSSLCSGRTNAFQCSADSSCVWAAENGVCVENTCDARDVMSCMQDWNTCNDASCRNDASRFEWGTKKCWWTFEGKCLPNCDRQEQKWLKTRESLSVTIHRDEELHLSAFQDFSCWNFTTADLKRIDYTWDGPFDARKAIISTSVGNVLADTLLTLKPDSLAARVWHEIYVHARPPFPFVIQTVTFRVFVLPPQISVELTSADTKTVPAISQVVLPVKVNAASDPNTHVAISWACQTVDGNTCPEEFNKITKAFLTDNDAVIKPSANGVSLPLGTFLFTITVRSIFGSTVESTATATYKVTFVKPLVELTSEFATVDIVTEDDGFTGRIDDGLKLSYGVSYTTSDGKSIAQAKTLRVIGKLWSVVQWKAVGSSAESLRYFPYQFSNSYFVVEPSYLETLSSVDPFTLTVRLTATFQVIATNETFTIQAEKSFVFVGRLTTGTCQITGQIAIGCSDCAHVESPLASWGVPDSETLEFVLSRNSVIGGVSVSEPIVSVFTTDNSFTSGVPVPSVFITGESNKASFDFIVEARVKRTGAFGKALCTLNVSQVASIPEDQAKALLIDMNTAFIGTSDSLPETKLTQGLSILSILSSSFGETLNLAQVNELVDSVVTVVTDTITRQESLSLNLVHVAVSIAEKLNDSPYAASWQVSQLVLSVVKQVSFMLPTENVQKVLEIVSLFSQTSAQRKSQRIGHLLQNDDKTVQEQIDEVVDAIVQNQVAFGAPGQSYQWLTETINVFWACNLLVDMQSYGMDFVSERTVMYMAPEIFAGTTVQTSTDPANVIVVEYLDGNVRGSAGLRDANYDRDLHTGSVAALRIFLNREEIPSALAVPVEVTLGGMMWHSNEKALVDGIVVTREYDAAGQFLGNENTQSLPDYLKNGVIKTNRVGISRVVATLTQKRRSCRWFNPATSTWNSSLATLEADGVNADEPDNILYTCEIGVQGEYMPVSGVYVEVIYDSNRTALTPMGGVVQSSASQAKSRAVFIGVFIMIVVVLIVAIVVFRYFRRQPKTDDEAHKSKPDV